MSKVVELLELTGVDGVAVRVKSAALDPEIVTYGELPVRFKFAVPVFCMVKVWVAVPDETSTSPKSVSSDIFGDVSPSEIDNPLPMMLISGDGVAEIMFMV